MTGNATEFLFCIVRYLKLKIYKFSYFIYFRSCVVFGNTILFDSMMLHTFIQSKLADV